MLSLSRDPIPLPCGVFLIKKTMFLLLFHYLTAHLGWKLPTAFTYSSTRMMLSAITTLLLTVCVGPFVIRKLYAMKTGQNIRVEDCPPLAELHKKKKETPSMGGILILSSMLIALFLWMDIHSSFTWILALTTIWLGCIGGIDDYLKIKRRNIKGLSARKKLLSQTVLASIIGTYLVVPGVGTWVQKTCHIDPPTAKEYSVQDKTMHSISSQEYIGRYYVPFYKDPVCILRGVLLGLGFLGILFMVTGGSNAVNLTDGLDGLAAGSLVMVSLVFALIAFLSNHIDVARYLHILYIEKSGEIGIYLFALMGACLGFLWYNGHPAQVFMGDTGSLPLGGIIGISAVLLRRELLLAIVGGVFVAEALSVIIQVGSYKLRHKRVFLCSPLHHHFEYKGWPETKVVLRFWIVGFVLGMLGLLSLKMQ